MILNYHSVKVFQSIIFDLFMHSVILNGNILCKFFYPVNWVNLLWLSIWLSIVIIYYLLSIYPLHLRTKYKGQFKKVFWPKSRIHTLMLSICLLIYQFDKSSSWPREQWDEIWRCGRTRLHLAWPCVSKWQFTPQPVQWAENREECSTCGPET